MADASSPSPFDHGDLPHAGAQVPASAPTAPSPSSSYPPSLPSPIASIPDHSCFPSDSVLKRSSPLSPGKPPQPPDKIDRATEIPDQFICSISSKFIQDPVVHITGETYDRRFIESFFNSGNRTCPRTQQIISDLSLTPNNLLRRMISDWCADHGITNAVVDDGVLVNCENRDRLTGLLNMISDGAPAEAINELRQLTRKHSSHRAMLGENPAAILKLISAPIDDPEVREDTATTILNLSIHDSNKKTVAEITGIIPFLIESLATGTMESRSNTAAALSHSLQLIPTR